MEALIKKTIFSLALVLVVSQAWSPDAKAKTPREAAAERKSLLRKRRALRVQETERMFTALNLTSAQREQMKRIMSESRARRKALRTQNLSPQAKLAQRRKIATDSRNRIQAVLTPAQRLKAAQLLRTRNQKRAQLKAKR
jgi:Spy/CpxP family protein refolding chaperone